MLTLHRVFFNTLDGICDAVNSLNPRLFPSTSLSTFISPTTADEDVTALFECSCFDGHYVTPEVTEAYLLALEQARGHGRTGAVKQPVGSHCSEKAVTGGYFLIAIPVLY